MIDSKKTIWLGSRIETLVKMLSDAAKFFENCASVLEAVQISAMNATAVNSAASDYQKIRTVEFTVPVIRADVLVYAPGELGQSEMGQKGAKVYYSEESLKDKDFLETVRRSPVSVGTHEKNTGEFNREIDGWIVDAWYDDQAKAVMARGYVAGADNVKYVTERKTESGFGTSAYIDFIGVKRVDGRAPNGIEYDAVTTKLVSNHLAILPNIRDKKNVIIALNAVSEDGANINAISNADRQSPVTALQTEKELTTSEVKNEAEKTAQEQTKMDKEVIKNTIDEIKAEESKNAEFEEIKNSVKGMGAKMEAIEKTLNEMRNAKNEDKPKEEEAIANADEAAAQNALPSQDAIADIANHLGVSFAKTPSVRELASYIGVTGKNFSETLSALNAKREEIKKTRVTATNSDSSLSGLIAAMGA